MTTTAKKKGPLRLLPRLGRRREGALLLPLALVVVVILSTFTLFAYRNVVTSLVEQERTRAARNALRLAEILPSNTGEGDLQRALRLRPSFTGLALVDNDGLPLATAGDLPEGNLLSIPDRGSTVSGGYGPFEGSVIGLAPFGGARVLRVDLAAPLLAAQVRSLPFLTFLVIGVNASVLVLLTMTVHRLFAPVDALVERAQAANLSGTDDSDELELLLSTFDRALESLRRREAESVEGDIEALQRALSPSLGSGLLLLDSKGGVLALNESGRTLLNVGGDGRSQDCTGRSYSDVLVDHPPLVELLGDCLDSGRAAQRFDYTFETAADARTLGLTISPLRSAEGPIRGWMILLADISRDLEQARSERLAESLARVGELTAGLAHELRNSLGTLRGYLELLARTQGLESEGLLDEMQQEAEHLQRVLEDFLSFAQPGSARMRPVRIEQVVRRAAADPALSLHDSPAVLVRCDPALSGVLILGDAQLLERAFRNLLHNAVRAQQEGECPQTPVEVWIESATEGKKERVSVRIEDQGPGLPDEIKPHLFTPFTTSQSGGVGLGLALALRIVSLHDGTLRLDAREERGTTARVELPLAESIPKVTIEGASLTTAGE